METIEFATADDRIDSEMLVFMFYDPDEAFLKRSAA
jgi:hypothetical protein